MSFLGIGGGAGAGGIFSALTAFNPATFFASLAATAATSALQQGAGQLTSRAGGGFWGNMLSSVVDPFSSGLTGFFQKWLGGADQSKRS
jgi:hypothetical protein